MLMMLAMLIATLFVIRRIPNRYESSAAIVIGNKMTDETRAKHAPRLSAKLEEITSRANLAMLIRKFDLYPTIPRLDDAIGKFNKELVTELKNASVFPNLPESIKISYRHTSPQKAFQVVSEIAKTFEEENFQVRQEALGESQRLASQIAEAQDRLKGLGPISDTTLLLGLSRPSDNGLTTRMQRETVQSTVDTLSDKKFLLEKQIEAKEKEVAEQEKSIKQLAASSKGATNPAVGSLIVRKAEIEGNIKTYADKYTDKHPQMVQWRNQIAEINRQIDRLESASAQGGGSAATPQELREFRTMQSDLARLRTELEITNREIERKNLALQKMANAPLDKQPTDALPKVDGSVRAEHETLLNRYTWLLGKQEEAMKLAGLNGSEMKVYAIVDAPNLPQFPVSPNKMMLQLIALGIAFGFGLLVAFGSEIPKFFLINDEKDVEYYLGAPVLAAIPETMTPIERSRKRKLKMTQAVLLLMLAAALVPAIILILNRSQIFHLLGNK
ncbi:MAG: hypothetical protein SF339_14820 [Blastocatellia bacterium]|nr:hypothetical protein [Blastocatellia bacterium]